jgi:hypothetical protein
MEEEALRADQLVTVYRKIRAAIDERETAYKEEIGKLKGQLDQLVPSCWKSATRRTSIACGPLWGPLRDGR